MPKGHAQADDRYESGSLRIVIVYLAIVFAAVVVTPPSSEGVSASALGSCDQGLNILAFSEQTIQKSAHVWYH
jgi:hypothetical protein